MAQQVDTTELRKAVEAAMVDLTGRIREEATERGKVATGATLASLRTSVVSSPAFVVGTLSGNENWRWWGNGRGPGRMPPVDNIRAWIIAKGLSLSPYAVAKRIAEEGSRDYRLKRTNVVEVSADAWQEGTAFDAVGAAGAKAFGDAYFQQVRDTFKPTNA
jgi:hypothetical protein